MIGMKNTKEHSLETQLMRNEIEALQQKLREAQITIDLIKAGNIDALVDADKNQIKIFTDKTSDQNYRTIVENMHEGAVTLNQSGTILYCNNSFAEMLELPLQRVIGGQFSNFIADASEKTFDALLKKGWLGNVKGEIHLNGNKAIVMPVLVSASTFMLNDSLVLSIILTDISILNNVQQELKRSTSKLEQSNLELQNSNAALTFQIQEKKKRTIELKTAHTDVKELEELVAHKDSILAILSHDLRSPLAGIIGTSEYLKSNFENMDNVDVKEMLDLLYESSKKELNMLDYLVEWARIKYASDVFSPTKIELLDYVKQVFATLKDTATINTINLHQEIEENTTVFADGKMLLSILQNIVSNAIKHSHADGKITITAKRTDDEVIVEIKDTGMGMSEEIQKNLFSPQMESLSEERKDDKGAGIGLLLVKGFLEKNGGRIWVESVEGVGSSFYFTLPINNPFDKNS